MKISLMTPWDNAWVPLFKAEIESRGHEYRLNQNGSDVYIHGWASGDTQPIEGARNIYFLRRYELFAGGLHRIDWSKVDALICVNSWIADVAIRILESIGHKDFPVHLIYNAFNPALWKYRQDRKPNHKIGMACHVHPKKNLPLAMQILMALPEHYELHIAGEVQDPCTAEYLNELGKNARRKVYLYGHIERGDLDFWWEQMGFCLSTSISEGNPNNVLEAMAKGIKPVVHSWPGAEDQFFPVFHSVKEAVNLIRSQDYTPEIYRAEVELNYSKDNIAKAVDIAVGP